MQPTTANALLERVQRIVADSFETPIEQVTPQSNPDTISNWDSLRHLNMVLTLEQEFGVEFAPEEIEQLLSVEIIADFVKEKTGE